MDTQIMEDSPSDSLLSIYSQKKKSLEKLMEEWEELSLKML